MLSSLLISENGFTPSVPLLFDDVCRRRIIIEFACLCLSLTLFDHHPSLYYQLFIIGTPTSLFPIGQQGPLCVLEPKNRPFLLQAVKNIWG